MFKKCIVFLICFQFGYSQEYKDSEILKILLSKYYANEKVIVKNRLQLLTFYCQKSPNNEETLEVISKNPLLKKHATEIKKQINNKLIENWSNEFEILFTNQNQYLKSKVNNCVSFEEFQALSKKHGENNQRLFIISKPMYFAQKYCLVKVTFYRNIEHNNGSFFLFEKINNVWILKETLNQWAT